MMRVASTIVLFICFGGFSLGCRAPVPPDSLKSLRDALSAQKDPASTTQSVQRQNALAHLRDAEAQLKKDNVIRSEQLATLGLIALKIDHYQTESQAHRQTLVSMNKQEMVLALEAEQLSGQIAALEIVAARAELLRRVETAIADARSAAAIADGTVDAQRSKADLDKLEKARLTVASQMVDAAIAQRDLLLQQNPPPEASSDWNCFTNAILSASKSLKQKKTALVQQELEGGFVCLRRLREAMPQAATALTKDSK